MSDRNPTYDHEDRLLDHEYDGIQEYDNPMPRWWVNIFWVTIVFAALYWFDVGPFGTGKGRIARYEAEMAAFAAAHPVKGPAVDGARLALLAKDPAAVAKGRTTFAQSCAACHRADAGGLIGPNLTDDYWLHGGTLPEILSTVSNGVLDKGMPAWGRTLKEDDVVAVVAYVATLHDTHPANPKPPQGVKVERDGKDH